MAEKESSNDAARPSAEASSSEPSEEKDNRYDADLEKLKELEELGDKALERIFENYAKNKGEKKQHRYYPITDDEIELAKKNAFGEDPDDSLYCRSFDESFGLPWGLKEPTCFPSQKPRHASMDEEKCDHATSTNSAFDRDQGSSAEKINSQNS